MHNNIKFLNKNFIIWLAEHVVVTTIMMSAANPHNFKTDLHLIVSKYTESIQNNRILKFLALHTRTILKIFCSLNAVREMCSRCPLVMNEDLLQDLTQYKTHRERSVMMAARSLIQLYRHTMPTLLHKKDRVII